MIDEEQLEEVTECKNLERLVTSRNEIIKEIVQEIKSGWQRLGEHNHFLKDRKIPICPKIKKNHGYGHLTSFDLWC